MKSRFVELVKMEVEMYESQYNVSLLTSVAGVDEYFY